MKDKASIIITMYNQKELLPICIKNLSEIEDIYNVIFIDNYSDDGTSEILAQNGYDYIWFDDEKKGYATLWNSAIDNFELSDVIIFMDIRYIVSSMCIRKLIKVLKNEEFGIVGPVSNGFRGIQYNSLRDKTCISDYENNEYKLTIGIDAGIWAISRETIKACGKFNNNIIESQNVLIDYELRMIKKGYKIIVCNGAFAYDFYEGVDRDGTGELENENDRSILKKNWNMNYFNQVPNCFLADLINENASEEFDVLEIGCDLGATLLEIKSRYPNSKIHGLEMNNAAVEIAKEFADVKAGNIEDEDEQFSVKFDYIIFGDVLEHLHNPQKTIEFCKEKLLKEHGCIIASIPNIMHISVMQQLLNGRFKYTDMGLLDKTHIHFFTYYEIMIMFQNLGFNVEKAHTTSVKISDEQQKLKKKLLDISTNVEEYMYDTYQYVIKARS